MSKRNYETDTYPAHSVKKTEPKAPEPKATKTKALQSERTEKKMGIFVVLIVGLVMAAFVGFFAFVIIDMRSNQPEPAVIAEVAEVSAVFTNTPVATLTPEPSRTPHPSQTPEPEPVQEEKTIIQVVEKTVVVEVEKEVIVTQIIVVTATLTAEDKAAAHETSISNGYDWLWLVVAWAVVGVVILFLVGGSIWMVGAIIHTRYIQWKESKSGYTDIEQIEYQRKYPDVLYAAVERSTYPTTEVTDQEVDMIIEARVGGAMPTEIAEILHPTTSGSGGGMGFRKVKKVLYVYDPLGKYCKPAPYPTGILPTNLTDYR